MPKKTQVLLVSTAGVMGFLILTSPLVIRFFDSRENSAAVKKEKSGYSAGNDPAMIGGIAVAENRPLTPARKLLNEWNSKKTADGGVVLTAHDFEMLKTALDDLDNRTAMFEKMPDGRVRIGNIAAGFPSVVLKEHSAALDAFNHASYSEAFNHSKKAVEALEAADSIQVDSSSGGLNSKDQAKIYRLAALSAVNVPYREESIQYAEKAVRIDSSALQQGLLADIYYNAGRFSDALDRVNRALAQEPGNESWKNLKHMVESKLAGNPS